VSSANALQMSENPTGPALTAPQKRFNTLIRQIDKARQKLLSWQDGIASYRQAHGELLLPVRKELMLARWQWLQALDGLLGQKGWTKAERATLRELLCDGAAELMAADGEDPVVKALFDKHAEVDFDTEQREAVRAMKDMTEAITGLDLGDDDGLCTDEDLFARMQQAMLDQRAADAAAPDEAPKRSRRHAAQQQRRDTAAQEASQSMREVYRKLVSALHPDREADEQLRDEKTVLMQRVNQAYERNDLLALLELQLQIEQIDESHLANVSAQRLKHYNKVLGEQLAELKLELERVEIDFRMEFGLAPGWGLDPRRLGQVLQEVSRQWKFELSQQQRDLHVLADVAQAKQWLKRQKQLRRERAFDDDFF
jgi:hypothetical protein